LTRKLSVSLCVFRAPLKLGTCWNRGANDKRYLVMSAAAHQVLTQADRTA
jgi:hypothetical protein